MDAKKASAEVNVRYVTAKSAEAECVMDLERHKARTRAAEMLIEVWRSENANARQAEKVY